MKSDYPMPTRRIILVLLASLLAGTVGLAQETTKKKRKPTFSVLYWEGRPKEELFYRQGESMLPLEFPQAARSKNFDLPGTPSFELFRREPEVEEGQPPFKLLASAVIPSGAKQVLFLVIPFEREGAMTYRIVAMDDSLQAFPRGSFRFANFTPATLLVNFDGQGKKLPSREIVVMTPKPKPGGGFMPFRIGSSAGETLFGTRLFGQPDGRELVFITPPLKAGGMPRVKFISQLVPPPPPE